MDTLVKKLDKFWWENICEPKWKSRNELKRFVGIICNILGIPKCDIHFCSTERFAKCIQMKNSYQPCGGACFNPTEKCIYYRDDIGHSLVLEELFHYIDETNNHGAIRKIMTKWYENLNEKKNVSRYFTKEK